VTEQTTKGLVEELGRLFDLWGYPDEREAISADLARRTPEELAREFGRAEDLLRGLEYTAETAVGYGAFLILGEAKKLAATARYICESYTR
jgi:hypothetical protein